MSENDIKVGDRVRVRDEATHYRGVEFVVAEIKQTHRRLYAVADEVPWGIYLQDLEPVRTPSAAERAENALSSTYTQVQTSDREPSTIPERLILANEDLQRALRRRNEQIAKQVEQIVALRRERGSEQSAVREFHEAFGHPTASSPTLADRETGLKRFDFMLEELLEYRDAVMASDLVEIADALGDLLYFVRGTAVVHGIDMAGVFDEIHRSNMSKLGEDGKPVPHPTIANKVGKGPNFSPPDLVSVLEGQGWRP